jgi:imidazolonepropionase-like amidohydrolase
MRKLAICKLLIPATDDPPIENGCLLIDHGRIEKVGTPDSIGTLNESVEKIDLSAFSVMPGMIDAHSHLSVVPSEGDQLGQLRQPAAWNTVRSIPNLYKNLKSGVVAQRIMGEEHYIDVYLKRGIQEGLITGPLLLVSGTHLVASNGHGVAITTADGEAEIIKLVRRNLVRGADQIKIFVTGGLSSPGTSVDVCTYTAGEVSAAVEEAERGGTYVAAHAHGGKGLDLCIDCGVRTIEHGAFVNAEQLERMQQKDMWLIGTFSILFHPEGIEKTDFQVQSIREKVLQAREVVAENFAKIIQSGVNLALGTDSMHGLISFECECLTKFGATNLQALQAVTRNAARACRIEDSLGTLEAGKRADFIAVEGNPLEDITRLKHVAGVYMGAERMD